MHERGWPGYYISIVRGLLGLLRGSVVHHGLSYFAASLFLIVDHHHYSCVMVSSRKAGEPAKCDVVPVDILRVRYNAV